MARVTCPQCGTERVVIEGKRKHCRKCGTPLTAEMAAAKRTAKKPAKAPKGGAQQSGGGAGSSTNPPAQ